MGSGRGDPRVPSGVLTCVLNAVTGGRNQLGDTREASSDIESLK